MSANPDTIILKILAGCIDKADCDKFFIYFAKLTSSKAIISKYKYLIPSRNNDTEYTFLLDAVDKMVKSQDETEKAKLLKIIDFLVTEKKINPEVGGCGKGMLSCLQMACMFNLPEVVKILVGHEDVDLNKTNQLGNTLSLALSREHYEIAQVLLDSNKNVNIDELVERTKCTPLIYAVMGHQLNLTKILLARGANPFISAPPTKTIKPECAYFLLLSRKGAFYQDLVDFFHSSIDRNKRKFQESLTKSLLEDLIECSWQSQKIKSLEFFLKIYEERKMSIDTLLNEEGKTYLFRGMLTKFYEGVKTLLKFTVNPNKKCYLKDFKNFLTTPLLLAIHKNERELVEAMLQKVSNKIPPVQIDGRPFTLLQYALIAQADDSIIEALLKKGIDPNDDPSGEFHCGILAIIARPVLLPLFDQYGLELNSLTIINYYKTHLEEIKKVELPGGRDVFKKVFAEALEDLSAFNGSVSEKVMLMLVVLHYITEMSSEELSEFRLHQGIFCELYCLTDFLDWQQQRDKLGRHVKGFLSESNPIDSTQLNYSARKYLKENNISTEVEFSSIENIAHQIKGHLNLQNFQNSVLPSSTWADGLISTKHVDVILPIRKAVNAFFFLAVDTMLTAATPKDKQKIEADLAELSKRLPVADGKSLRHLEVKVTRTLEINGKLYDNCPAVYEYRTQGKGRVICYQVPNDKNGKRFLTIGAEYLEEGLHDHDDIKSFESKSETKPLKIIYKSKYLLTESNINSAQSDADIQAQVKTSSAQFVTTALTSSLPEIHQAAAKGNIPWLKESLDKNKDNLNLPSPSTQATPIFHAIKEGQLEAVKFLLSRGARVDLQTRSGNTVLDICNNQTQRNKQAIFYLLKQYGAKSKAELEDFHQKKSQSIQLKM